MPYLRLVIVSFLLLVAACAGPRSGYIRPNPELTAAEAVKQQEIALSDLLAEQERLYRIGYPVLKAGLPHCGDKTAPFLGFDAINSLDLGPEMRQAAQNLWRVDDRLRVIQVIPGTAAARAGVQVGDIVLQIDDWQVPATGKVADIAFEQAEKSMLTRGRIALTMRRGSEVITRTLLSDPVCDYALKIHPGQEVNAFADGKNVVVHRGALRYFTDDDHLALVLSHELAHNAMRHIDAMQQNVAVGGIFGMLADALAASQGVSTGGNFTKLGANFGAMQYGQDFEREADYIGLYIMASAGYDIADAPNVWRRLATLNPQGITIAKSHPTTAERFVALEQTVKEIQFKKSKGIPLHPEMKPEMRVGG